MSTADAKPDLKLSTTRTPVLGDHLSLLLPATIKMEQRRPSIMAAEASQEDETRGVFDSGSSRLVFMAYELYATPTSDFKAAVTRDVAQVGDAAKSAVVTPITLPAPLTGFAAKLAPDGKQGANLIYIAYVASADHSVQQLAFYLNPQGMADVASYQAAAEAIVKSIVPGKRKIELAARDHKFRGAGTDKLVISAPANITSSSQDGPDFSVYRLREVAELGAASPSCGIYLGGHPSYQHKQVGIADSAVKNIPGKLLGQSITWHAWSQATNMIEAMVDHPKQKGLVVHVFCSADKPARLDDMRKMAETLRVEP